jgi:hypothetical protein
MTVEVEFQRPDGSDRRARARVDPVVALCHE